MLEDDDDLRRDPLVAVERHWPGASDLLRQRGVTTLTPVTEVFNSDRLTAALGVTTQHTFGRWLSTVEARPSERADAKLPWP